MLWSFNDVTSCEQGKLLDNVQQLTGFPKGSETVKVKENKIRNRLVSGIFTINIGLHRLNKVVEYSVYKISWKLTSFLLLIMFIAEVLVLTSWNLFIIMSIPSVIWTLGHIELIYNTNVVLEILSIFPLN